jgi:hypothetical protein
MALCEEGGCFVVFVRSFEDLLMLVEFEMEIFYCESEFRETLTDVVMPYGPIFFHGPARADP